MLSATSNEPSFSFSFSFSSSPEPLQWNIEKGKEKEKRAREGERAGSMEFLYKEMIGTPGLHNLPVATRG
jgi:hypothetical protein